MSYGSTMRFLRTGYSGGYSGMVGGSAAPAYLCDVFCTMRAAYLTYRNAHWMVRGPDAYGLHLLFERLYNESKDNIDQLAEQIVGTYGSDGIREDAQILSQYVTTFAEPSQTLGKTLLAALTIRDKISQAYAAMRSEGTLTPGWDSVLSSLAGANDKHLYLIQQSSWRAA